MSTRTTAFDYQQRAFEFISTMVRNLLLIAPMSAGKTRVAIEALKKFGKGALVAPTRPLCNEHYHTLCEEFDGNNVVLGTRDFSLGRSVFEHAPYRVLTFFKLIQLAIGVRDFATHCPVVVFDEIDDLGPAYQVAITLLRVLHPKVKIIAMTGTMHADDIDAVAKWLDAEVIKSDVRPTDLHFHVVRFDQSGPDATKVSVDGQERHTEGRAVSSPEDVADVMYHLIREGDLNGDAPVLAFSQRRRQAREVAQALTDAQNALGVETDDSVLASLGETGGGGSRDYRQLRQALQSGVGLHHGGLPASLQQLVEQKGREGLDAISACYGFVRGVNFPFGHVMFPSIWDTDWRGGSPSLVTTSTFQQVAARAGRIQFGRDGHIWVPVFSETEEVLVREVLVNSSASRVNRQLGAAGRFASTVLTLMYRGRNTRRKLQRVLESTLWASTVNDGELQTLLDDALHQLIGDTSTTMVREEGEYYRLTQDGRLAARLGLHPAEYELVEAFVEERMEFSEWVELLAQCFFAFDGVEVGEDWKLVEQYGLSIYKAPVSQEARDFADYVQRMIERVTALLKLCGREKSEVDAWCDRVYRPYVCGQLPIANALYDLIGRKQLQNLVRYAGQVMGCSPGELKPGELSFMARVMFRGYAQCPTESLLAATAEALGVELEVWTETVTQTRKEVSYAAS